MYYLQSRYYNPTWGRFINADSQSDSTAGFVGCNLFAYCANSPVSLKDASGKAVETAVDIISAAISLIELIGSPSWANAGYLVWDIGSAVIPFLPGSYVAKGGKIALKIGSKIDDFVDGSKLLTGTYKGLKKMFKGISNIDIHHLVEKRFKGLFSSKASDFLSIPLPKELHKVITQRWRNLHKIDDAFELFKCGSDYSQISFSVMEKAIKEVYNDMPGLLDEVLAWFRENWRR